MKIRKSVTKRNSIRFSLFSFFVSEVVVIWVKENEIQVII